MKITRLLRRLLAIYSRSIKRLKLKYFLRYYNNAVFSDYIKYQKLNNMFKKKKIQYHQKSKNNKYKNINNNLNFRTMITPSQYSYMMNCSEPIIIRPSDKNLAFLMTPCFIMDNDDINLRNIIQYNKKFQNNMFNKYNLTSRNKIENVKRDSNTYIFDDYYFNEDDYTNMNTDKKRNQNYIKKLSFLNNKSEITKGKGNKRKFSENKRAISTERLKNDKNIYNYLYDDEFTEEYFNINNKKNLYLREDYYVSNSKKKMIHKNKNKSVISSEINPMLDDNEKNKNCINNKINLEIFSHLFNNKYKTHLRKVENEKIDKENNNIKGKDITGINTERRQYKNYRIFERNNNGKAKKIINDSHEYILQNSLNINRKSPYKKIIKNCIFSTTNLSLKEASNKNKNINSGKNKKKINKNSSLNNISNNSNSQSNNQNLNHISTNYSVGPLSKDNQILITKKTEDKNKNNKRLKCEYNSKNELNQDNLEKNTSTSNRISLQSLSDSKMMELAGHYGYEDSSSENCQMSNIILNKKHFSKKNN